jgi:hypothetical protein
VHGRHAVRPGLVGRQSAAALDFGEVRPQVVKVDLGA